MDPKPRGDVQSMIFPNEEIRKIIEQLNESLGISGDPVMTLDEIHQSLLDQGVRPEDNGASRELYRMRYGDNWKDDWPEE